MKTTIRPRSIAGRNRRRFPRHQRSFRVICDAEKTLARVLDELLDASNIDPSTKIKLKEDLAERAALVGDMPPLNQ